MPSFPSTQNGLTYLGPNAFSVTGDSTNIFKPRRALVATAAGMPIYGIYVMAAVYTAGVTVVTTAGAEIPAGLTGIQLGQDPDNAPIAKAAIGATGASGGIGGGVPTPAAGQQNHIFAGDGSWHDPIVDIQVWS